MVSSKCIRFFLALGIVLSGCAVEEDSWNESDEVQDGSGFHAWNLKELGPDEGITVMTPEFDVPPGSEIQSCYFFRVPDLANGADLWVSEINTAINPGSHHMNVLRVRTIVDLDPEMGEPVDMNGIPGTLIQGGPCFQSGNWSDWPLVANSQKSNAEDPYTNWELPEGVAMRFQPGEMLMLQTHYVNATTQETPFRGKVGLNMILSPEESPIEMGTLFATQQNIRVCQSRPAVTYSGTCSFPQGNNIVMSAANGHFHSRGEFFSIYSWDGTSSQHPADENLVYFSESWDDPPMETEIDFVLPEGGGIWWDCDYQWIPPAIGCDAVNAADPLGADDCCYTFGSYVETSEHCNAFVYYYPKVENTDVFCN